MNASILSINNEEANDRAWVAFLEIQLRFIFEIRWMPMGKTHKSRPELFIPEGGTTLLHRVDVALRECPHLIGRNLLVETNDGIVIVRGFVDTYFAKQMAQEALRNVQGIRELRNHLEVAA